MCKVSVQNDIVKDILKKKNDVHQIPVRTLTLVRIAQIVHFGFIANIIEFVGTLPKVIFATVFVLLR